MPQDLKPLASGDMQISWVRHEKPKQNEVKQMEVKKLCSSKTEGKHSHPTALETTVLLLNPGAVKAQSPISALWKIASTALNPNMQDPTIQTALDQDCCVESSPSLQSKCQRPSFLSRWHHIIPGEERRLLTVDYCSKVTNSRPFASARNCTTPLLLEIGARTDPGFEVGHGRIVLLIIVTHEK